MLQRQDSDTTGLKSHCPTPVDDSVCSYQPALIRPAQRQGFERWNQLSACTVAASSNTEVLYELCRHYTTDVGGKPPLPMV